MKYDQNIIYRHHWGGGETIVYEVDEFRAVVNIATGSGFYLYKKEDVDMGKTEKFEGWWNFHRLAFTSMGLITSSAEPHPISDGWEWDETLEECIDRHLAKARHLDTYIQWYEKLPDPEPGHYRIGQHKICYSYDNSEENKSKIQSNPNFIDWFDDYWKKVKEENDRKTLEYRKRVELEQKESSAVKIV